MSSVGRSRRARPPGSSVKVVGFLLNRRLFSTPLTLEPRARGQEYFHLVARKLPDYLAQFQEAFDIVLESLPEVDWTRCSNGDATVTMMARQVRTKQQPRWQDAHRGHEPEDEQDVFMNLPHHDDYWPGSDLFVVSDAPFRTLFYPEGPDAQPRRFPAGSVVRYDAQAVHSAPGFCPASEGSSRRRGVTSVVRTFMRVHAWDPLWTLSRLSHFAPLLQKAGPQEWHRPQLCEGEDVILGCFDELHSCQRCCDLSKGPLGDSACWAGRMNFNMCCGPASRLWAGCGWRGEDLWGHEYYSLEPPRLHSAAQCQNRCEEDSGCGGWTYFPDNWEPVGCRLPVAAILGLRRVCVLRATIDAPWSPHSGAIYGLRDCADLGGCLEVGRDRVGMDLGFIKEVPSAAACRLQCHGTQECKAFSYFPDGYLGDASAGCVLPAAVFTWWKTRCLLKMHKTKPGGGEQWLPMGNVASGQRGCKPARPWRRWSSFHQSEDDLLAVDGDYRRERCSRGQPWRMELDAEYIVTRVMLWTGQLQTLPFRELLVYEVTLMVGDEEVRCGSADENLGGNAMAVHCAEDTSRRPASAVIIRSSAGPAREFALCEVEVQVAPVPCDLLLDKGWTIHGRVVLIFPPGEASRAKLEDAGEACERAGGSFVETRSRPGRALCVEAACAPSRCLEEFDTEIENFAPLTVLGLWSHDLERVADECGDLGHSKARMFEATVMIYNGGHPDVGGSQMTTHWCFCAPSYCADDDAAMVVTRLVARHGLTWEALQPNSEIELRNVRALASWEDVKLDFLVAGFARSGTHTLRGNLMEHPQVKFAEQEMTFNWAALPQQLQVWLYASFFKDEEEGPRRRLWGGKGEGLAASQRVIRLASKIPNLRLVVMVREPVEWLESLYNLRKFYLCQQSSTCSAVPSMEDVVLNGETFEDVNVEDAFLSKSLEHVVKFFPPSAGRSLLLEFELLRSRPRELFDQITSFLGIEPFSRDFEIRRHATEDRRRYEELGLSVSLCSEQLRPSLAALKERLARENEYTRLVALLAQAGAPWVSSRLLLNRTHCD